jgi:hypothetical protein
MVPVNIADIVQRLSDKNIRENEKFALLQRLETIRDYCAAAVVKHSNRPSLVSNRK